MITSHSFWALTRLIYLHIIDPSYSDSLRRSSGKIVYTNTAKITDTYINLNEKLQNKEWFEGKINAE